MPPYIPLSQAEIQTVLQDCGHRVAAIQPEARLAAVAWLARFIPQQWPVEWYLPLWLGRAYGVDPTVWYALTTCNVLGLGFVAAQDDLMEAGGQEVDETLELLAPLLHQAALTELHALFPAHDPFWSFYQQAMTEWQQAQISGDQITDKPFALWQRDGLAQCGWRGAPLKITATALCLLAGRAAVIPRLHATLNALLAAQVLLDHLDDWQEDLTAGRFNIFVAFAADQPQWAGRRADNQRRTQQTLMRGDPTPYFALIDTAFVAAQQHAAACACPDFSAFLAEQRSAAAVKCQAIWQAAQLFLQAAISSVLTG